MNLLIDKDIKKFLLRLILLLLLGIIFTQILTYINTLNFKKQIMIHDYKLAGYMQNKYPEMKFKINSLFTAAKTDEHLQIGKELLKKSGYKENSDLNLFPQVNAFYKTNILTNLTFSLIISITIFFLAYLFLKTYYKKIDQYNDDVNKIINGDISTRLADNNEGNLGKLAASINIMTTSLNTHIEKEKQSRIFLKDILTNISHQLKTPLTALMMYIDIMKDEDIDNKVINSFLNKSENELDRMQTLITNLLKLAKLDAGIIVLNKSNCILKDIIEEVVRSFEIRILKEKKDLKIEADGKISYYCDKEWLLEALSNLLKNAVEHTTAGNHIKIKIEETPLLVKIIIKDDGTGIHPDDITHIFKRFYRSRFSQNKQGTGIGLTLSKSIIEMHNGFITVQSTIEKGTTFTVHLPKLTNL